MRLQCKNMIGRSRPAGGGMNGSSKKKSTPFSRAFPVSPIFRPPDRQTKFLIDPHGVVHLTLQGMYENGRIKKAVTKCGWMTDYPMRPAKNKRKAATCLLCLGLS